MDEEPPAEFPANLLCFLMDHNWPNRLCLRACLPHPLDALPSQWCGALTSLRLRIQLFSSTVRIGLIHTIQHVCTLLMRPTTGATVCRTVISTQSCGHTHTLGQECKQE